MRSEFSYIISQGLFLKSLGWIYFLAFLSLSVQVKGLYGSRGIHPIHLYLDQIKKQYGKRFFHRLPTLFWWRASDRCLLMTTWAGMVGAFLIMLGVVPAVFLLLVWICYYSFCQVGYPFLAYQWDALLLETGFLSIFFAIQSPPPLLFVYLMWFLLFRLLFSSGLTKLLWGSKEWKHFTAMDYHYETQPLPTPLGYYAHQQPKIVAKLSVWGTYFFELVVPFLLLTPVSIRIFAGALSVFFQLLIFATGNYAFFNLLTIVLCLPLIPDHYFSWCAWLSGFVPIVPQNFYSWVCLSAVAVVFFVLNTIELMTIIFPYQEVGKWIRPFQMYRLLSSYGLFVHMTTIRDEITVEGSLDGKEWKEYAFKWKPGDPYQRPRFVAPHQPRLDWQMWFAALGSYYQNRWLTSFLYKLLEGSGDVLHLLKENPFPDNPPTYIRSRRFRYHFTDCKTKKETGRWWTRTFVEEYSPVLILNPSLDNGETASDREGSL